MSGRVRLGAAAPTVAKALGAIADGDIGAAIALVADAEWQAFHAGSKLAGELGYARWRLEHGDRASATAILRQLRERHR
jgi:hypothetical protein